MLSKLLWSSLKVSTVTALLQTSGGSGLRSRISLQMSEPSPDKEFSSWSALNPQDCKDAKDKLNIWPLDDFNTRLLNEVHPKSWTNINPEEIYDFIAIGAGAGGLVSSRQVARRGGKSAMISSHLAGGDCLNVGCVPSKALIRCARMIRELRKAKSQPEFGVRINGDVEVDFGAIMERMRKLRAEIAPIDGHERGKSIGTDVYQGFGRFVNENTIEVIPPSDEKPIQLRFKKAAICTGGRARIPSSIPGLMDAPFTTNETLFNLTRLPPRMVILGSGVVALEMAQVFATFGTKVTVLVRSNSLFPRVDPDVGSCLKRCLEEHDNVTFLTMAKLNQVDTLQEAIDKDELPLMRLTIQSGEKEVKIDTECLLVATGREPNVENLNLEAANIAYDTREGILVDDHARSITNPNVFSVGDCTAAVPRLTHMSGEMAKLVVNNALFDDDWKLSSLVVPSCMYTEPEFASVGDVSVNHDVDIYTTSLEHNDRSILDGDRNGFVKIYCEKGTGKIKGCSIVASRAGELINEVSLAIKCSISLDGIGRNIHCYPTTGEAVMGCGLQFINANWKRLNR